MRILVVNYEFPPLGGGAGNATAHLSREMALLGHDVTVLTSSWRGLPSIEHRDGFSIVRVPVIRRRMDRCTPLEMLTFVGSALFKATLICWRTPPQVIITFFGIPCGPIGFGMKALFGIPYVVSLRGGDVPGFQPYDLARYHRFLAGVIRFLWRHAGSVVANSNGLARLASQTAPELPLVVIPNGVDPQRFSPSVRRSPEGPLRVGVVGRLVFQKGVDVLLHALPLIPSCVPISLDIIGDGGARPELERLSQNLGLERQVRFLGWKTPAEMPGVYRGLDVFALPSRDEGMPNVVLEAMASGLPVVATQISGNEELIVQGKTGFLVPPEAPRSLADALMTLARDPVLRDSMGLAARILVEEKYTWSRVAKQYLHIITHHIKDTHRL